MGAKNHKSHENTQPPTQAAARKLTGRNSAEILGLVLGLLSGSSGSPTPGTPAWAVEQTILEKWPSMDSFGAFFDTLPLEERRGWISQLKGRAAEYLVAHETGGAAHADWGVPDHDVVTPEGDLIQVKAGASVYVAQAAADVPDDIAVHTGSEGKGVQDVTAHDWSAAELEEQLDQADASDDQTLDILGGSMAVGVVLSGREAYRRVKAGAITLNQAPRFMAVDSAGNSARCAVIGVAVGSGSPVVVTAGVGYLLYRNRTLLGRLCGHTYRAITHPRTKKLATGLGRLAKSAAVQTYHLATGPTAQTGGSYLLRGVVAGARYSARRLVKKRDA